MMNKEIRKEVIRIMEEVFEEEIILESIGLETDLIEAGIIDSMQVMDVILKIEETFEIEFESMELLIENFKTIKNIECLIEGKIA